MKRLLTSTISLCLVCAAFGVDAAGVEASDAGRRSSSRRDALRALSALARSSHSVVVDFKSKASHREVYEALDEVDAEVVDSLPEVGRVKIIEVEPGTADEAAAELEQDPAVEAAEIDTPRVALGVTVPNDPRFSEQWALHNTSQDHPITDPIGTFDSISGRWDADIDAPQAWAIEDGSTNEPVIAVLDVGADITHPEIANNRWTNPGEIAGNQTDDDGNGKKDDLHGWDFQGRDATPDDPGTSFDAGHGTHVAAIAAAVTDNSTGVAGVCPGCEVLHMRFGLTLRQELKAIDYLIATVEADETDGTDDFHIPVLNASFGSPFWSQIERNAFERLGEAGVLTIAAAGNGGLDNDMLDSADFESDGYPDDFSPLYPASYELPGILSVAASNSRDQIGYFTGCDHRQRTPRYRCLFSNWGRDSVDVAAPGVDMTSAVLDDKYDTWNGTSMAAPAVSGIAGLVAAAHPDYGVLELKNAIMGSVDKPDSLRKLWREPGPPEKGTLIRTNGRVNAKTALETDTDGSYRIHDGMIAGAIRLRSGRRGALSWPGDTNDVFMKRLDKNQRYVAKLEAKHLRRNLDLVVYKPGTQDVWQLEDGCAGGPGYCSSLRPFAGLSRDGSERVEFTTRQEGPHYFLVSSYFVASRYRLEVRRAAG